ncbi:MAG: cupin domain-containing protein [Bacteroidota bacterium]
MIIKGETVKNIDLGGGVTRRILAAGGKMMAVEVLFKKGAVGAVHTHPHEQIGYVLKGSFELQSEGKKEIIKAGDSYYTTPNQPHGVVALEDGILLDIFTPQREDFLK